MGSEFNSSFFNIDVNVNGNLNNNVKIKIYMNININEKTYVIANTNNNIDISTLTFTSPSTKTSMPILTSTSTSTLTSRSMSIQHQLHRWCQPPPYLLALWCPKSYSALFSVDVGALKGRQLHTPGHNLWVYRRLNRIKMQLDNSRPKTFATKLWNFNLLLLGDLIALDGGQCETLRGTFHPWCWHAHRYLEQQ